MNRSTILNLLTEDLLERILEKLDCSSDQKAWRLVCTEFCHVDSGRRKSIRVLRPDYIPGVLVKCPNVEHLDLSICPRFDDKTVFDLLSRGDSVNWTSRIKTLVLSRSTGLKPDGLERLMRACPVLEAVDVSYCWNFGDREAMAISRAKGLREINMDKCFDVTDVGLANIAIGCPKLESLSLKWCLDITDMGVELLAKKCSSLKSLDVSYLKLTSEGLRSIASLSKLEVLIMVGCSLVNDTGLERLRNGCPLLQEINVSRCVGVTATGLISVIKGHLGLTRITAGYCISELSETLVCHLNYLKNLKSVNLDGAIVSHNACQNLRPCSQYIIDFGLGKCIGVIGNGVVQLVCGNANLRSLDLTCCESINDETISAIARSCSNLICLKLEACNSITEKGLDLIGTYCVNLEELDLTDCSGVTDKGLKSISRCSQLSSLKLGLCTDISYIGLAYIGKNCSKLRELDIYRCTIGDNALYALARGCKYMQKLNISYCEKVTDRGMVYVAKMKELCDLEMRSLVNVTGFGITAVAMGCNRLAELDLKRCQNIDDPGFYALAYNGLNLRQINLSHCSIEDEGLLVLMSNLSCIQDAKLVDLSHVSVRGFELALRSCCFRLKKVKLLSGLRSLLSQELILRLEANGCKVRWE